MLIDTHAHLIYDNVKTEEIVKNMKEDGLEKIITIGTDVNDSVQSLELANQQKDVYCMVGIHPEYADGVTEEDINVIDKLAENKKVVGIGEIGLDYHYTQENVEKQKEVFVKQIKLAHKHSLPICIHSRDASEDTYQILLENQQYLTNGGVMHCYCYDVEYAKKFVELGFYVSFAGNYTYKKYPMEVAKNIPLDKILVETDSPFLTPVPFRGQKNEPKMVCYTAQKIADVLEMDIEQFKKQIIKNTYKLFNRMKV